jgi:hypothetical protein
MVGQWALAATTRHAGIEVLNQAALFVTLLFWCMLDARIHDKPFQHGIVTPFAATWPISVAFYLVWTRGWRAGLSSYAKAVGLALTIVLAVLALRGVL